MFTLYSGPNCPGCKSVKQLLDDYGVFYQERDVSNYEVREELFNRTGFTSVPVLDANGDFIKGFDKGRILNAISD